MAIPDGYGPRDVRGVGWAMHCYGSNKSAKGLTPFKACLGNYECPIAKCEFSEQPSVPRGSKKKSSPQLATETQSPNHKKLLVYVACNATLKTIQTDRFVDLHHSGHHPHRRPHPIRSDLSSRIRFEEIVKTAPEARPKSLQIGRFSRPPLSDMNPSFNNLSRLEYSRNEVLALTKQISSIGNLAFESNIGIKIMASTSVAMEDEHIVLMKPFMNDRLMERQSSFQTDTTKGFFFRR
ncbi:hypothetical protein PsorP6_015541 [Peronosclerospora sorghi]|uniref:Uncharacterized protein n=1 Tax=Peronosclerospora sorghi TaxID=230839 RepID=A0ACC0WN63_9STRA|nr:hypothetical protein PsorP6_015541 [Peronosclerospora sorghi]